MAENSQDGLEETLEHAGLSVKGSLRSLIERGRQWLKRFVTHVPQEPRAALAHALKQNALARRRTTTFGEVLPGMRNDLKFAQMRVRILEKVAKRLGKDIALECSWLLSSTGFVPSPCGVPSTVPDTGTLTNQMMRVIRSIRWMAKRHYRDLDPEYSVSIPKKSTFGYPYYTTGDEGLLIRCAYIMNYLCFSDEIKELAEKEDWVRLATADLHSGRLPMQAMMSVNYRLQPSQAQELLYQGDKLVGAKRKERIVMDAAGQYRAMDFAVPFGEPLISERARAINQCSGGFGQYLQLRETGHRRPYYGTCAVFKLRDIPKRAQQFAAEFSDVPDFEFASWDFGGMEKSQTSILYEQGNVAGWRDAGMPAWFVNMRRAVHYSPYLLTDDDPKRPKPLPIQLKGRLCTLSTENDLGKRSGEDDTDTGNKDFGFGIYNEGVFEVGGYGPVAKNHRNVESFMEEFGELYVLQGRRVPGAPYGICGNSGDDCLTGGSRKISLALDEWFKGLKPVLDIRRERDTQFLGCEVKNDGTAYAYLGKFYSNKLSAERFYTSPMRRDNWPLGIYGWLEHYASNPLFNDALDILNEETALTYGTTVKQLADAYAAKEATGLQLNMADTLFLHDPSTLQWGRVDYPELSGTKGLYPQFYLNVPPEWVAIINK